MISNARLGKEISQEIENTDVEYENLTSRVWESNHSLIKTKFQALWVTVLTALLYSIDT